MPLKTVADEPPALNLIPMIDIMFNVIIFFLVTSKFATIERDIPLRVPEVVDKGALTQAPQRRVVNVHRSGQITLDGATVTLEQLISDLQRSRRQYSDLGVLVRGDRRGEFQLVAEVLNACKQAGIQELGISVHSLQLKDDK
jgi:biopolymer transport protein ExbD